jgi:exonuclease III
MDTQAPHQYRIVHINIWGIRTYKQNLMHYLSEIGNPEVVTLNETKLGTNIRFELLGYYCASRRAPTEKRGKHGSMILVHNDIENVDEIDSLRSQFREEVIGIEIRETQNRPQLNVIAYYNPPTNTCQQGKQYNF